MTVPINRQQSKNIKRRRKCNRTSESSFIVSKLSKTIDDFKMLEAPSSNKLQKHRWKFNENERSRSFRCLSANKHTNHHSCPISETFYESKRQNDDINSENLQQKCHLRRASNANCRKLKFTDWMTTSSVRKLLPIFILVNMLPFLYAGESRRISYLNVLHEHIRLINYSL